ncbi:hypothetical protein WJX81_006551 [Elliptochloris bilobata]|uniref:Glutathione S-transferase n=1 Tax=Elliptochloris bilobata TaxID=381761 RepID=A0AAW1QMQ7_9CHLO
MLRRPFQGSNVKARPCQKSPGTGVAVQAGTAPAAFRPSKPTLFDVPLSNHGARCRYIIYSKELESQIDINSPKELGGLASEQYLALSPEGKMPLLVLPDGTALPECEVITQYLVAKYKGQGPDLLPAEPEAAARAWLISRIHDQYVTPIQACMYRSMNIDERAAKIAELARQLGILEGLVDGPHAVADAGGPTTADAALFPTLVFCKEILCPIFGWEDLFKHRPKLGAYFAAMQADTAGARVIKEVEGGLEPWKTGGRFKDMGILDHVANPDFRWAY